MSPGWREWGRGGHASGAGRDLKQLYAIFTLDERCSADNIYCQDGGEYEGYVSSSRFGGCRNRIRVHGAAFGLRRRRGEQHADPNDAYSYDTHADDAYSHHTYSDDAYSHNTDPNDAHADAVNADPYADQLCASAATNRYDWI